MDHKDRSGTPNLILAIILSVAILFAWDYFMVPQDGGAALTQTTQEASGKSSGENPSLQNDINIPKANNAGDNTLIPAVTQTESLSQTLSSAQRLPFENTKIKGSINLDTGYFDDLALLDYKDNLSDDAKPIRLFSPHKTEKSFFADFGYTTGDAADQKAAWEISSSDMPFILQKKIGGILIERMITLDDDYMFTISDRLINDTDKDIRVTPYGLLRKQDSQQDSDFVVHTGFIGWIEGALTEYSFSDLSSDYTSTSPLRLPTEQKGWVGLTDKYWMATLIPEDSSMKVRAFYHKNAYQTDYVTSTKIIPAGDEALVEHRLFSGAKSFPVIEKYEQSGIKGFDYTVDWGWFWFFTKPIFKGLLYIYGIVQNYGIAILILTLLIKTLFFPLANKSYTAMSRMKKLQPEMQAIREKHGSDPMKQQQELVALYKKEKVNPVAGCWPMLLQIPVFYALYKVLSVTIELRHAPFFGWIQDLSAKDPTSVFNLFGLLPFDPALIIPSFLNIGLLPILMGITMWMQQRLNPASPDPMQARLMGLFPFVFTFILAPFAAGLVLYWTWNNILSIIQQSVIMKRSGVDVDFRIFSKKQSDVPKIMNEAANKNNKKNKKS